MKKAISITVIALAWLKMAAAQEAAYKFDFGASLGMSSYMGDACNSILKHPGLTGDIGARYVADTRWAFRAALGISTLSGDTADMDNVMPSGKNFSFSATAYTLAAQAEFNFMPYGIGETYKKLSRWTPYAIAGLGVCMSSISGSVYAAPAMPLGVGVKYKVTNRMSLVGEFTMTKVFGDKVDGPALSDPLGIKTKFFKDTDWISRLTIGIAYEFGERCSTCNYLD